MKKILSLVLCLGVLFSACAETGIPTAVPTPIKYDTTLAFCADTHYVSSGDDGVKLSAREMPYNRYIVAALLYDCMKNGFNTLLILGDLTNTGSEEEHSEMSALLQGAAEEGLDIYVLPGECDLKTIGADGFKSTYGAFGFDKALSADTTSLSYSAVIEDKLVVMLDTTTPTGEFAGEVSADTLQWLESQLIYAQEHRLKVITASHNTLVNYVPQGQTNPYDMTNGDKLIELLNRYAVQLHLSGHRHSRQVNSFGKGEEIMIDMPTKYPNSYGHLYFGQGEVTYLPHTVDVDGYAKKMHFTNRRLQNFNKYSKTYFDNTASRYAQEQLDGKGLSKAQYQAAYDTFIKAYNGHMDGTLYTFKEDILQSEGYAVWQSDALKKTRHGQWMPVWLDKCNSKSNGFTRSF
ncbi:MAG: metallophosphoesterase [Oscillospiraceae bacterium]